MATNPNSFPNSPEFGDFISTIRSMRGRVSRKAVEDLGGPSERQQADIEAGKEMPITPRTRDQYGSFLENWRHPSLGPSRGKVITRQFFDAACEAFSASASSTQATPWVDDTLLYDGGFVLGDLAKPGAVITAGSLAYPGGGRDDFAHDFADRAGGTVAFTHAASGIAARHNVITVMPWPVAVANNFTNGAPWSSLYTYRVGLPEYDGFPRLLIDPLDGVSELEQAYIRAAALGAAGDDRAHLAWAILLANASAARWGTSPLKAWTSLFAPGTSYSGPRVIEWENLMEQIHEHTGLTTTVPVSQIILKAQRYLLPWVEEWNSASGLRFSTLGHGEEMQITWADAPESLRAEWDPNHKPAGSQLWFCEPAMLTTVPAVLNDRGAANLVLDTTVLSVTGSRQPRYVWCPVGAGQRHVIVQQDGSNEWRPALLY
ncbi:MULTISPECIES: hypothetical protein [Mycolicibacterium]|nr:MULTISPECIES: hypothetical protein [Mycolicibacterium]